MSENSDISSRSIVLIGLMGAGKTCIGKRLAQRLELPFSDSDAVFEAHAGMSIADYFARFGEADFRQGERRVIAAILDGPRQVLALGGGAFMDLQTRTLIKERAVSLWLRADLDLLVKRTEGRSHRPLLNTGDPQETLRRLMDARYPIYAEADVCVESADDSADVTTRRALEALARLGIKANGGKMKKAEAQ